MTFPSTETRLSIAEAWSRLQSEMGALRQRALNTRNGMASGDVSANVLVSIHADALRYKTRFIVARDLAGVEAYARDQLSDQTFDLATEINAVVAAIDTIISRIETDFPQSSGGWLQINKWDSVNGGVTVRAFTSAQTVTLQSDLTVLAGTIE